LLLTGKMYFIPRIFITLHGFYQITRIH